MRRVIARVESGALVREPESDWEREMDAERLRSIFESRRAPIMGTSERMYLEGRTSRQGFDSDAEAERYIGIARKAGINTHNRVYHSQLARKGLGPRDPLAWVNSMDELSTNCRLAGKSCEALGIHGVEAQPVTAPRLAEDLIEEKLEELAVVDEGIARDPKRRAEARAQIIERHGQKPGTVIGNATVGDQT